MNMILQFPASNLIFSFFSFFFKLFYEYLLRQKKHPVHNSPPIYTVYFRIYLYSVLTDITSVWLVGWLVLFYVISTLFGSFNTELSHFVSFFLSFFFRVYGISTLVGHLMPNPFLYK